MKKVPKSFSEKNIKKFVQSYQNYFFRIYCISVTSEKTHFFLKILQKIFQKWTFIFVLFLKVERFLSEFFSHFFKIVFLQHIFL